MFLSVDRVTGDGLVSKSCYVLHDPQTEDVQQVLVHVCLCFIDLHSMTAEKHIPSSLYTKTPHICQTARFITRVNWFSSGLQSAFRESIGSVRGFGARFASQLVQFGASARYTHTHTHTLSHPVPL